MMLMRKLFLITFLLFFMFSSFGQTPGFAGKRFSINGGLGLGPAIYSWMYDADLNENISTLPNIGLNVTPEIGVEYALSKGVMVGGSLKFNKLNMPMTYFEDTASGFGSFDFHGFYGETKVKSNYWSVYFKFYKYEKKGAIAPIGRFHQLEFIKGSSTVENGEAIASTEADFNNYLSNEYNDLYYFVEDVTNLGFNEPVKQMYLKYAYGYETVLFDKIAATMSLQFSAPLHDLFTNEYSPEGQFKDAIEYRGWGALGLSMNFGIGYLVF